MDSKKTDRDAWYERNRVKDAPGKEHHCCACIIPYAIGGGLVLLLSQRAAGNSDRDKGSASCQRRAVYKSIEPKAFMFPTAAVSRLGDGRDQLISDGAREHPLDSNVIARYALKPLSPRMNLCSPRMERVGGKCLIFDGYSPYSDDVVADFGLLAIIEIHRSEMEYARSSGGAALIERIKKKGYYPYSDLDREPVV